MKLLVCIVSQTFAILQFNLHQAAAFAIKLLLGKHGICRTAAICQDPTVNIG